MLRGTSNEPCHAMPCQVGLGEGNDFEVDL